MSNWIDDLNQEDKLEYQEDKIEILETHINTLREMKNTAYQERDKLVAALSKIALAFGCQAGLAKHPAEDIEWEDDWRNIVFIETPLGEQMSWHIHDSELPLFEHLDSYNKEWDGHTTEEKYERLENINWEH